MTQTTKGNQILPSSMSTMMKYLVKATAYGMISIFVSLSTVNAYHASPSRDELTLDEQLLKEVQQKVKKAVRSNGVSEVSELYEQVVFISANHQHPVVRQFMTNLKHWLEDNYQSDAGGRRDTVAQRPRVRAGAYLQPEVKIARVTTPDTQREQEQEEVVLAEVEDEEHEVYTSPFTPQPKETTPKKAPKSEPVEASTDFQRYQLEDGYIDLERVQETWLDWVNGIRADRGLPTYSLISNLNKTASSRASTMRKKESADHKRFSWSSYYDYIQIENWFADAGVRFTNDNRSTFTENVGYSYFTCDEGDCTAEAIDSMRSVFDYFISEEGKAYDLHRRTIIHPKYKLMGFGLSVDEENNYIYSAMHYGTELVEE